LNNYSNVQSIKYQGEANVVLHGLGIVVILSLYCWFGIKKAYEKGETLPLRVSIAIWVSDTIHFLLVLFASLNNT